MEKIITQLNGNKLLVKIIKEFYQKEAVFAATYKVPCKCVSLAPLDEHTIGAYFELKDNLSYDDLVAIAEKFTRDLVDEQFRLDLEHRYGKIRGIIVQHAFSPISNIDKVISND